VLAGVVADPEPITEHQRGDLGTQLFLRIALGAERVREIPVQPRRMAGPMTQLVKGAGVKRIRALEAVAPG
jgi:hypothetical protein